MAQQTIKDEQRKLEDRILLEEAFLRVARLDILQWSTYSYMQTIRAAILNEIPETTK